MANAVQTQVSDGTLNVLQVGLAYFEQADIGVSLSSETLPDTPLEVGDDYQWTSATSIQFLATALTPGGLVPNGVTVTLKRTTNIDSMRNIYDGGAPFSRTTLDENFTQLLFVAQEFAGASGMDEVIALRNILTSPQGAAFIGAMFNGEVTVQGAIDGLKGLVDTETNARIAALSALNTSLTSAINAEAGARQSADNALGTRITTEVGAEATARQNADTALGGRITTELAAEVSARQAADTTLTTNLNAEITARQNAVSNEATLRTNADNALGTRITTELAAEVTARNAAIQAAVANVATGAFTPEAYGAVGNGTTNDTAAIQAACNAAAGQIGGQVLLTKRYLLDATLTIPRNVRLIGTWNPFGAVPWKTAGATHNFSCTLIVNPATPIQLSEGSGMENLSVLRKGMTTAENTGAAFTGTAINGLGTETYPNPGESNGIILKGLQIIGFEQAIRLDLCPRTQIEYISGDCLNGISIGRTYDVLRMKNCHFWPFSTYGANLAGASLNRGGVAYNFTARNDIAQVDGCFSYGYNRGFRLTAAVGTCTFSNCAADGTGVNTQADSIGYLLEGNTTFTTFIGCVAYSNRIGIRMDNNASTDSIVWTNCRLVENQSIGLLLNSGNCRFIGGIVSQSPTGISVTSAVNASLDCSGVTFNANSTNDVLGPIASGNLNNLAVATPRIILKDCKFDNAAATITGYRIPQIASGDPLNVPRTGDVFLVEGTTAFGTLGGGFPGRIVTLQFTGGLTVFNNPAVAHGAMHLNGNAQWVTTENDTIQLMHNGRFWVELSRSINP